MLKPFRGLPALRSYRPVLETLEERTLLSFLPPVDYGVGDLPTAVAVGDVNGDGAPDVVSGDLKGVSVLLNNGDGSFTPGETYATGNRPYAVALSDLAGTGNLDLVVANGGTTGDDTVSVLRGNGDGAFQAPVNYHVDYNPKGLSVADLNGDGKLDIVSVNEDGSDVSVMLGNGDGTFQNAVSYKTGGTPRSIAVGDLTGTGKLDIVVAGYLDYGADVLLGNGDGSFQAPVHYDLNSYTDAVALGDLTGTGKLDLLAGTQSSVKVLPGNGDGTFGTPYGYSTGGNAYAIAVDDFNADGTLDFATVTGSNSVQVFRGNGDGTFQASESFDAGPSSRSLTSGDLNGDGLPDLVTASLTTPGSVSVLLNAADWGDPAPANPRHWRAAALEPTAGIDLLGLNADTDRSCLRSELSQQTFDSNVRYMSSLRFRQRLLVIEWPLPDAISPGEKGDHTRA
jgi:hypothetical protein